MPRTILVHLNVTVPDAVAYKAEAIGEIASAALFQELVSAIPEDWKQVEVVAALAEEI